MANSIGTHVAELIEQVKETTWALDGMGRMGTHLNGTHNPDDYINVIEMLAELNAERLSNLTEYLENEVIPAMAQMNKGAKP
jgi:hypothetical protein